MFKKIIGIFIAGAFVVSLSGCATGRKQKDLEIQGLKNQVSVLEAQLQSKDEEINSLRESLNKAPAAQVEMTKETSRTKVVSRVKSRPKIKDIQIALRNAGYDPGPIDGKMGKQTREAIKDFQKANNLPVNGKADKETWTLLRDYRYKKMK